MGDEYEKLWAVSDTIGVDYTVSGFMKDRKHYKILRVYTKEEEIGTDFVFTEEGDFVEVI